MLVVAKVRPLVLLSANGRPEEGSFLDGLGGFSFVHHFGVNDGVFLLLVRFRGIGRLRGRAGVSTLGALTRAGPFPRPPGKVPRKPPVRFR